MDSIDESSTDDNSDEGYISTNVLKEIWGGSQIYLELNARNDRLNIRDRIRQTKLEWKGAELSAKSIKNVYIKYLRLL